MEPADPATLAICFDTSTVHCNRRRPLSMLLPAYTEYVILRRCKALTPEAYPGQCGSPVVSASAAQWTTWMLSTCNLCGAVQGC